MSLSTILNNMKPGQVMTKLRLLKFVKKPSKPDSSIKICLTSTPRACFSQSLPRTSMFYELSREIFKVHKFYIIPPHNLSIAELEKARLIPIDDHFRWHTVVAKSKGEVMKSGGGIGKLDAANEAGFFHRKNRSRLDRLKEKLKQDKSLLKGIDTADTSTTDKAKKSG